MARPRRSRALLSLLLVALLGAAVLNHAVESALTNITSLCSPHATPPPLKKGELTYVCINVNDDFRTVFMPVADKFTVLRVTDCTYTASCVVGVGGITSLTLIKRSLTLSLRLLYNNNSMER